MTSQAVKRIACGVSVALCTLLAPVLALAAPAAPADDIRDIRPLISIPPWWYWLAAGVAAALVLALIFAGIRYWRGRRERALTPEQRALQALTEAEALARAGQCHQWAEIVAPTLRSALAARLGQENCPETTSELAAIDWANHPLGDAVDMPRLLELLFTCDLTRFALGRLEPSTLLKETAAARAWVSHLCAPPKTAQRAEAPAMPIEVTP